MIDYTPGVWYQQHDVVCADCGDTFGHFAALGTFDPWDRYLCTYCDAYEAAQYAALRAAEHERTATSREYSRALRDPSSMTLRQQYHATRWAYGDNLIERLRFARDFAVRTWWF